MSEEPSLPTRAQADALAGRALARAQRSAWEAGTGRSPARPSAEGQGLAPWDQRRQRARALGEDDPEDRGPGLPPGRDRPGPTRFDPRTGSRELARMVDKRGWGGKLAMAAVVAGWEEIVGRQVAEHCAIESFEAGRITLRASSSSWAQQLRLMQPVIEARVAQALRSAPGAPAGRGPAPIELRILGPAGPTWKRRGVGLRGARGPRDTYG
ncbi:DUF721 domain-containing protein [Actinomyces slackii]|uniref:Zn-ribbon-containing, possibly RNA-binding protein and truncated derivatives n=1 Tax=Actinomyces slackii TaxID=52774 RepID=A0A3S4SJ74_9ACTO|nr:DciA family protein [Actinomyces slackii]VEG73935.1 Zn-ribbon-containing, possibly RNA-binding protein and truncated derivatives [Actinomyces slackii]